MKIPKEKINGERFGQFIYNVIRYNHKKSIYFNKEAIADILFNIENDKLQKIINKYLKKYVRKI